MSEKKCNCVRYKKNIGHVNGSLVYAFIHGIEYKGESFDFCPWCGQPLKEAPPALGVSVSEKVGTDDVVR